MFSSYRGLHGLGRGGGSGDPRLGHDPRRVRQGCPTAQANLSPCGRRLLLWGWGSAGPGPPLRSPTCGLPAPPGARPVGGSRCATAPRCARRERGSTLPRVHKELGIQVHTGWSLPTSFTFSCLHPLFPCPLNFLRTHWSDSRDLFFNSHPYVES